MNKFLFLFLLTLSPLLAEDKAVNVMATYLCCNKEILSNTSELFGVFAGACVESDALMFDYEHRTTKDKVNLYVILDHGFATLRADIKKGRVMVGLFSESKKCLHEVFVEFLKHNLGASTVRKLIIHCDDHFSVE